MTTDKTPGAMVLEDFSTYGSQFTYRNHPAVPLNFPGSFPWFEAGWNMAYARAMVEQTPAVGGEPETVAWMYLLQGSKNALFSTNELEKQGGIALCQAAHLSPLLAEIERYKTMSHNYCALGMDANTRIADLEALCGEIYQILGALDAPAQVLDKVYAASNGDAIPSGDLLPFVTEPTAKIVLPDRADEHSPNPEDWGWNDCLDEVTRLNGGKP